MIAIPHMAGRRANIYRPAGLACLALLMASAVVAHGYKAGTLSIHHPWSRATPAGAKVAAGYLTIHNAGTVPDRLLGGESEAGSAVEVHEMSVADGVMRMRALPQGLEIPAGATVELALGGTHLMITGLKRGLWEGEMVKVVLKFEKAGSIDMEFEVQAMGAKPAPHGSGDDGAHTH